MGGTGSGPTPAGRRWTRIALPFAAGAVVTLAVIGVVAVLGDGAGPAATSTTTTGSAGTSTTTAGDDTSTTTSPPETTTTTSPGGDGVPDAAGYVVTGVAADDVLNVRSRPDPQSAIVATLAPDAVDVPTTGLGTRNVPEPGWWEVALGEEGTGWVNSSFLSLPDHWSAPTTTTPCIPEGSAYDAGEAVSSDPNLEDADHIFALEHLAGDGCDRVVVVLGKGGGWGNPVPWPSTPADFVPAGVRVTIDGNEVTVAMPMGVVDTVRPTATEATLGDAYGFVVRRGAGPLDVKVLFPSDRRIAVSFLDEPARIVIDARSAPTGTGLDMAPVIGDGFVLPRPIQVDLGGPGVTPPIAITVYGRPFEAQGAVEVRTVGSGPGTGTPVPVGFDGDFGPVTSSMYSYRTTDYAEAWGVGSFTITSIPPGDYELFVGEFSPKDGLPVGLYEPFTVAG